MCPSSLVDDISDLRAETPEQKFSLVTTGGLTILASLFSSVKGKTETEHTN